MERTEKMAVRHKAMNARISSISIAMLLYAVSISAAMATDAISVGADAFRPLKNSAAGIAAKEALVYDTPSTPSGAFYGLFEIKFTIDRNLQLNNPKVQIFVQKQGDTWKKIAELTPPAKPASGDWTVSYIWNSRAASYEWTDTTPFKANLSLKFKLIEN